jgi:hypothetical protein
MPYENKQMQENQPAQTNKKEEEKNKGASVEPRSGKRMFDMMKPSGEEKQEGSTGDKK